MRTWARVSWLTGGALVLGLLVYLVVRVSQRAGPASPWRNLGYNVAVSSIGFLFSLALAVGLYYLKRLHDRRDVGDKEQAEIRQRFYEAVVAERQASMNEGLEDRNGFLRAVTFMFAILEAEGRITDPTLSAYLDELRAMVFNFLLARDIDKSPFEYLDTKAYGAFVMRVSLELAGYIHNGFALSDIRHEWQEAVWSTYAPNMQQIGSEV